MNRVLVLVAAEYFSKIISLGGVISPHMMEITILKLKFCYYLKYLYSNILISDPSQIHLNE